MSQAQKIETPAFMPGIYSGISNAAYHADRNSYSSSIIKLMDIPAIAWHRMNSPSEQKEAFRFGTAAHTFILEPERIKTDLLTGIDCARRSKADKAEWSAYFYDNGGDGDHITAHPAAEWNGLFEQATGKVMVNPGELAQLEQMAASVRANPNAQRLLSGGEAEQSVYWVDDETGLNLRCRPDYMNDDFIVDLKTIQAVDDRTIDRAISGYGYNIQDAMYSHGCKVAYGKYRPFVFIFIQSTDPFLCRVIALSSEEKERGWNKYEEHKQRLAECLASGEWPGVPDDLNHTLFDRSI